MSFIKIQPPENAKGELRAMYEHQQNHWGYVPNYAMTFSLRPEVLSRWGRLLAEIRRPLDDRTFELVTFAAAIELKHTSCSLAHGAQLRAWFKPAEIKAIANNQTDGLEPADREMVRFSRQIARDASVIQESDIQGLRDAGFDDATIFDIAATAAGRAFFTKLLDALGSEPDSSLGKLGADLTASLSVGRPISGRKPSVMTKVSD